MQSGELCIELNENDLLTDSIEANTMLADAL
jgi:hypothetical protein